MLTRMRRRICEWLSEPVYFQTVPWTWSVTEPHVRETALDPKAETLNPHMEILKWAGIQVFGLRSMNAEPERSRGSWRMARYSQPETLQEARRAMNREERLS